jgi:hypothetical protein
VKPLAAALAAFLLAFLAALQVPSNRRLELYDVQDLVYNFSDFPTIDIILATSDPVEPVFEANLIMLGRDLASRLQPLVPDSDVPVQFQNGLLIVRGTMAQHLAVRAALAAQRLRNSAVTSTIDGISRAKAALQTKLFGMITR